MGTEDSEDDELMWGEEPTAAAPPQQQPEEEGDTNKDEAIKELEAQLHAVRKELAAKTVQLKRQEGLLSAAKQREAAAEEEAKKQASMQQASVAASAVEAQVRQGLANAEKAVADKEGQVHHLCVQVQELEESLKVKEEEAEGLRRVAAQQKRALAEAAASAAERTAAEEAGDEASRAIASAVAEEELEALQGELAKAQARAEVEAHNRAVELAELRKEVSRADDARAEAVAQMEAALNAAWQVELEQAQMEAALNAAWQVELEQAQAEALEQKQELEARLVQLRTQLQDKQDAPDSMALTSELAMLQNAKVQVQREYDAFRSQATQAARNNREEIAGLLAENADLKTKLARKAADAMMTSEAQRPGVTENVKEGLYDSYSEMFSQPTGRSYSAYAYQTLEKNLEKYMPGLFIRMEHQRKGLLPCLVLGSLFALILTIAIVRAAASAHSAHAGPLCMLSKLGINVGSVRCGQTTNAAEEANKRLANLLDNPQRVHDIEMSKEQKEALAAAAAAQEGGKAQESKKEEEKQKSDSPAAASAPATVAEGSNKADSGSGSAAAADKSSKAEGGSSDKGASRERLLSQQQPDQMRKQGRGKRFRSREARLGGKGANEGALAQAEGRNRIGGRRRLR